MTTKDDTGRNEPTGDNVTVTNTDTPLTVASNARVISGRILPWGERGATSAGGLEFTPSAIRIPRDISRVKLLRDHSPNGVPVGVMTSFENKPDGLYASFTIANTPDGDRAIEEARSQVRDSFSVEVGSLSRQGTAVQDSVLRGVALVPFPAFASALVDAVTAADAEAPVVGETADETDGDENELAATDTDDDQPQEEEEHEMQDSHEKTTDLAGAVVPGGLPIPASENAAPALTTASEVAEMVLGIRNGLDTDEAHAALADITNSGMLNAVAPAWLGQLWAGVTYQRRLVPLVTNALLRDWKAVGYRWTTKPTVDKYAGDKADIPTNTPAIEAVEVEAERWAGGHDIDRKFFDFNDSEFLAAYWAAMAESYAYETDKALGEFLVKNATAIETAAPDLIRAVATAAIEIDEAIHTPATFAVINPADLTSVLSLSQLDAPRFMDLTPVSDPSKWVTSEFVEKGSVLVGAKSAVTHFELAGSPLRAQAEHIAKGGFDAALFGYTAAMVNKAEGLRSIKFGTPAA